MPFSDVAKQAKAAAPKPWAKAGRELHQLRQGKPSSFMLRTAD
jgi:hypothetical protein